VLARIVAGLLHKQIAAELGTTEATVKQPRARVMQKMTAGSVADLGRFAGRPGSTPAGSGSTPPKAG
jgi:FixJ family two-component response regulator